MAWRAAKPALVALVLAGSACPYLARGQCMPSWSGYGEPFLDNAPWTLAVWEPGGGEPPLLIAGGNMHSAGATQLNFVGAWDGTAWRPMGPGVTGTVASAAVFDPDGAGPLTARPVIGGYFSHSGGALMNQIAFFDGSNWQSLGGGVGGSLIPSVRSLVVHGPELVIGGQFYNVGGVPAEGIGRWNGTNWDAFPGQALGPNAFTVHAGDLYAGGIGIDPNTGVCCTGVLRWNGQGWGTVGTNYPQDNVYAIASHNGNLYAGGSFSIDNRPTNPASYLAVYDGVSWSPVGDGLNDRVVALCSFDPDGPGPAAALLIAGGYFTIAGGQNCPGIAAWDGSQWLPLGSGLNGAPFALAVWQGRLAVGGGFTHAGGVLSPGLAFWGCPQPPFCYADCDGSAGAGGAPPLNVADFTCFLQKFAGQEPYANCDGSTSHPWLNVADFTCFLQKFAGGCP